MGNKLSPAPGETKPSQFRLGDDVLRQLDFLVADSGAPSRAAWLRDAIKAAAKRAGFVELGRIGPKAAARK